MFDTWRFHAFFTTTNGDHADTVTARKTHRGGAIIEQVHSDLESPALTHAVQNGNRFQEGKC